MAVVVSRMVFSLVFLLKWRTRYMFIPRFIVPKQNLSEQWKHIQANIAQFEESSDDEDVDERLTVLYGANKQKIDFTRESLSMTMKEASLLEVERHENNDDPDHDFSEFPNADAEEMQDSMMMQEEKLTNSKLSSKQMQ